MRIKRHFFIILVILGIAILLMACQPARFAPFQQEKTGQSENSPKNRGFAFSQPATPTPAPTQLPQVNRSDSTLSGEVMMTALKMREDTPIPRLSKDYHPFEEELADLINVERKKAGLEPVKVSKSLSKIAREHSTDMATHNFFGHNSSNGLTFEGRLIAAKYPFSFAAENLGAGTGPYNSPEYVLQAWLKSANHRANLLNPLYTEVGIGYYYSKDSTFGGYFTADFGKPR